MIPVLRLVPVHCPVVVWDQPSDPPGHVPCALQHLLFYPTTSQHMQLMIKLTRPLHYRHKQTTNGYAVSSCLNFMLHSLTSRSALCWRFLSRPLRPSISLSSPSIFAAAFSFSACSYIGNENNVLVQQAIHVLLKLKKLVSYWLWQYEYDRFSNLMLLFMYVLNSFSNC